MARYIDEFESPMVGAHFDVGNVINSATPTNGFASWANGFLKLHIKEFNKSKADKEGNGQASSGASATKAASIGPRS